MEAEEDGVEPATSTAFFPFCKEDVCRDRGSFFFNFFCFAAAAAVKEDVLEDGREAEVELEQEEEVQEEKALVVGAEAGTARDSPAPQ